MIDLIVPVVGNNIPVDHSYALYSSLCKINSFLHNEKRVKIHPIRGFYLNGDIILNDKSCFIIRTPLDLVKQIANSFSYKKININNCTIQTKAPNIKNIFYRQKLFSNFVTIKGKTETDTFCESLNEKLKDKIHPDKIKINDRKIISIKNKKIVGFSVLCDNLTEEESFYLQLEKIGGRSKFGGGFFL